MPSEKEEKNHLHLIDGSGFIFRAYYALPPLTRSDGLPVGAVAGFCNMIYKLMKDGDKQNLPTHIAIVFDHKGKTFRSDIYPNYKKNIGTYRKHTRSICYFRSMDLSTCC